MKFLVLFGLYLVIVAKSQASIPEGFQTNEFRQYLNHGKQLGRECGLELGPAVVRHLPDISGLVQYPEDNDSLNALWGCLFKKRGIVDEQSYINNLDLKRYVWEIFTAVGHTSSFYAKAASNLVKSCNSVKGDNYGQTAVKLRNCVHQYLIEKLRK